MAANGSLAGTGLTFGVNAIDLSPISPGEDIGAYVGLRSGQASLAAYRALINNTANWITQDAGGDQGIDTIAPDVPFSTTAFTASVALPSLSINNVAAVEGDAGTTTLQFTVTLSSASASSVTADFATADDTATLAGSDYAAANGTLTFAPGETVKSITVSANGDTAAEPTETLRVNLSNAVNATIGTAQGTGTITNDDFTIVAIHDIQGAGLVSSPDRTGCHHHRRGHCRRFEWLLPSVARRRGRCQHGDIGSDLRVHLKRANRRGRP